MPTPHTAVAKAARGAARGAGGPLRAHVAPYRGKPVIWVNGEPLEFCVYSPVSGRRPALMREQSERFARAGSRVFFLTLPPAQSEDFWANAFWDGDTISSQPLLPMQDSLEEEAAFLLNLVPDACFIIRYGPNEPQSWRALHPDQLVVNEAGATLPCPSLASREYNQCAEQFVAAVVHYCEGLSFGGRIIGYWSGHRTEGSHDAAIEGWLFDHSAPMRAEWDTYLQFKYGTLEQLRRYYGPHATFGGVPVPTDLLRRSMPEVVNEPYWQSREQNAPLRDYLELGSRLWAQRFTGLGAAMQSALRAVGRERVLIYDALKQPMQGWSNYGFFHPTQHWPVFYPDISAASGALDAAPLLRAPGVDGLITPHDYQARGAGGVYEPEAAADSCVLAGKLYLCEMDTRTWCGSDINFPARNLEEFEAVTWRNLATGWSRGFHSYWMDVYQDWFAAPEMHPLIARQMEAQKEALHWEHQDVPGIAVVIDDSCVLETNGSGHILNEHVSWEWRGGLARCGVPFRLYLLSDLENPELPDHRLFYFPNLYRTTPERLSLLQRRVFGHDRVVLWGPGSGISDGETIAPQHAAQLTGFEMEWLPLNDPRRVYISNFDHPITAALGADTWYGSPTAYGPVLYPADGLELGRALMRGGRDRSGLALKTLAGPNGQWHSVFSIAAPLPACLWRELARIGGAHVYQEEGDVLLASKTVLAVHSLKSGPRTLRLPGRHRVRDVVQGQDIGIMESIQFNLRAPQTAVFHLEATA